MRAWIIWGLLIVSTGSPRSEQQQKPDRNTQKREKIPPPPVVAPSTPPANGNPAPEAQQANSNKKTERYWKTAFAPQYLSNWVLAAVAIGGIFLGLKTLKAIRRQGISMRRQTTILRKSVRVAERNARAAKRSIEMQRDRERARVSVLVHDFDIPDLGAPFPVYEVRYEVKCFCPTPAFIVEARAGAYLSGSFPSIEFGITMAIPKMVTQTSTFGLSTIHFAIVEKLDIEQLETGKLFLYFYGFIKYRDIHHTEAEPPHETVFHYVWKARTEMKIPGIREGDWYQEGDNRQT